MPDRTVRIVLAAVLILLALYVAQPYVQALLYAAETPRAVTARGDLAQSESATIALFERASPSVVHVFARSAATGRDLLDADDEGGEQGGTQTGTGFVWDGAGHVVTNTHVVQNAAQSGGSVSVRMSDGEVVSATLVGLAPSYDLAVLRLGRVAKMPPPLAIGTSADLKVGQSTFAIGNPFGLDHTLTTGVISAVRRRMPTSAGRELSGVIQTDAAINPGNSGGPLLDSAGRLIGVNTAIVSPSGASAGIGFAIPVDVVNRVVPELIRVGRVRNPGIGIIAAQEAAAARLGIDGVVVLRVLPGSPASQAGLRGVDPQSGDLGDVIVAAEDRPIRRLADLTAAIEEAGLGAAINLKVVRGGRIREVRITTADVAENRR
ncbi:MULTISPECIES: trypsin-like peptidase domain-containing protein [unclassified Methylobacterium]|uniref:S1C family serine protease n=1 Tax=unclassified Methylobacterium TaxID=2615210 RepID=UPI0011C1F347|nr:MULTISPECIES: trypsin-like peptidase domain-containing protein [unclassified Methylobacterium]QEE38167.1 trypsin-like serine protease [Methylobacterium sp. WL1]TXN54318.1 trypsin-like serine protease [Methylobacterium sp. WL2]